MVKKAKKGNFVSFMRKSPLLGVKLDLNREQTPTRKVKLRVAKPHETKMIRIPTNRPPTHPGEMLFKEFLKPAKITQRELAARLRLPYYQVSELIHGKRRITLNIARRLGKLYGMDVQFGSICSWCGI